MSTEDSWVFDSLVCFLHGPIWNAPLQTFIEEKSLVFDPNLQPAEDDPNIVEIHNEYKNLVDYMLGSFMEEMQITPEQFELACMEERNQQAESPFQMHQRLFQQIWAANDVKIFIRMMTQRNVELQLQALDLIEKNQLALLQNSERLDNSRSKVNEADNLTDVDELIAKSVEKEMESPEAALTPDDADHAVSEVTDKFDRLNLFFEKNDKVNPEEVLSRQEYLRQQRDKIVEIKKKTRAKQLQDTVARDSAQKSSGRPNSAQVAQKLLENGGRTNVLMKKDVKTALDTDAKDEASSAMQLRKTLAKRLRSEVVEHREQENAV